MQKDTLAFIISIFSIMGTLVLAKEKEPIFIVLIFLFLAISIVIMLLRKDYQNSDVVNFKKHYIWAIASMLIMIIHSIISEEMVMTQIATILFLTMAVIATILFFVNKKGK